MADSPTGATVTIGADPHSPTPTAPLPSPQRLKFGVFIVKCPFLLCAITMFVLIAVLAIDAQVFALSDQDDRTFLVETHSYVEAFDAYNLATQYIADGGTSNNSVLPQTESDDFWIFQHMFTLNEYGQSMSDDTDYWILTPDNVEVIVKYEDMIALDEDWKNQFCYVRHHRHSLSLSLHNPSDCRLITN